ncbi:unnamed protein product [Linum trigynum]|uniref:KIB1-4 beta-propeller domain-containing protein n=1 Tax=Linum trigynum TaxID=586398 RepID=A0AAV2C8N9_9ROSI
MTEEEEEQRDWKHLPGELLDTIICRLTKLSDLIHFQAVCKPWRRTPPKLRQTLPWLVSSSHGSACHRFTDVTARNDKWRQIDLAAGDAVEVQSHGSALGWMLLEERRRKPERSCALCLMNPFTRNQIHLPAKTGRQPERSCALCLMNPFTRNKIYLPGKTGQGEYLLDVDCPIPMISSIKGFAMSDEVAAEGYVVIVLCSTNSGHGGLAFCKLGAGGANRRRLWSFITLNPSEDRKFDLGRSEIAFSSQEGILYVLCPDDGRVFACDLVDQQPVLSLVFHPANSAPLFRRSGTCCYRLVESPEGELMLLIRTTEAGWTDNDLLVVGFSIYQMSEDEGRWEEMRDIGEYALFFDSCKAIYVSVKDHPECVRNCVYERENINRLSCGRLTCHRLENNVHGGDCWILPSNY